MKELFTVLVCCVAVFLVACKRTGIGEEDREVHVTPTDITLSGAAHLPAADTVSVASKASWRLTVNQSWLGLTFNSDGNGASGSLSGTGNRTVFLVAEANPSTVDGREAIISSEDDKKLMVKQLAAIPPVVEGVPWTSVNYTPAHIDALKLRKVYFGHKSVGGNIVAGIKRISSVVVRTAYNQPDQNDQSLRTTIEQLSGGPAFVEHDIGSDGLPLNKIASFERFMNDIIRDKVEITFFKFCYMDLDARTDVNVLFDAYKAAMDRLQARFPTVIFAHFTVPLYAHRASFDNRVREQFSDRLRETYKGNVFDIAVIESVDSKGATSISWDGVTRAMADEWTDDGGHLNEAGQNHIAGALIAFLAQLKK